MKLKLKLIMKLKNENELYIWVFKCPTKCLEVKGVLETQ